MNMVKKLVCGVVCAAVALGATSVWAGSTSPYGEGGEVTFVGDNKDAVHTFTATGDNTFELFSEQEVWFLVVGGGGAGGNDCAGGGGAGGFVESNSVVLAAGTYTVTVGAGGQPTSGNGGSGGDSAISNGGVEKYYDAPVVGVTNGGGIRASIEIGEVAKKDINTVLPFGNTVFVVYVTGSELLEALEASTFCTPEAIGGFPQTCGIEWTLDTTAEYDQGEIYTLDGKESSYYAPASIKRVSIQSINGEPFDEAATYAVVTNNFCAAGGDTYNVFNRAYAQGFGFDTGIPMDEAVMDYITEVLEGVIGDAYAEPSALPTQIR